MSEHPRPPNPRSSHREAIRSTSLIGGASFINIGAGVIRLKIAAVILGPVGIGLIGLLQNLLNAATTLGGMGIATAGAREIVATDARDDPAEAAAARTAVGLSAIGLSFVSALLFWALSGDLAGLVLKSEARSNTVALLAIAVAATVASGYPVAIITASHRVGDLAKVTILSAIAGSFAASLAIAVYGTRGIIPFVLAVPIATLLFGIFYLRRGPSPKPTPVRAAVSPHLFSMLKLGAGLTLSIFISLCGQLFIRTRIASTLGAAELGHFQAAWLLTTVYLQFLFQTMGSDYLPRLTASVRDVGAASRLISEQTEIGLLLAAPVILLVLGAAPWILTLLYTSEFTASQSLLRWQVIGDLFRLVSWPSAFLLLARNSTIEYAVLDIAGTILLVIITVLLIPRLGLVAPGIAYAAMNACYLVAVLLLIQFRFLELRFGEPYVLFGLLAASCAIVFAIGTASAFWGAPAGMAASAFWGLFAINKLRRMGALPFSQQSQV